MCGIAGILKVHPPGSEVLPPDVAIPESWLDVLDESIKHRGPDGQGRFRDRATRPDGSIVDVALVHRRLAIIDLAGGQQPMVSERGPHTDKPRNGRVAVVFNGCIYNHRELRRELQSAGHKFITDHSDTEVLIHGWREWGHALFAKLDGMFAVGIWDAASATLVLARDRFGEKPLYFEDTSKTRVLCSTASGLLRLCTILEKHPQSPKVHAPLLVSWLACGYSGGPPIFDTGAVHVGGVHTWGERDHTIQTSDAAYQEFRWGLFGPRESSISAQEVDAMLQVAVESRLEADVPLGVFLSGGVDSALVANYAKQLLGSIHAFTVRMPSGAFDESAAAAETARSLNVKHEILDCSPMPAEDLVSAICQLGLPFGDSSLLPAMWVSRAARQSVPVALGGDGGDELFLGYERHRAIRALASARRLPGFARRLLGVFTSSHLAAESKRESRVARFFAAAESQRYDELLALFPRRLLSNVVSEGSEPAIRQYFGSLAMELSETAELFESGALAKDLTSYLPEDLLRKTDTASMSVALEVRAPFLAKELVDRMIRVRPDVLMPDGQRKGLLKAVARKYLPDEIVDRPKMGFSIPIGEWFRTDYGGMKQLLLDTLNSADPFPEDILGIRINRTFVARMVEDHMDHRRDHSQRLYMLLVLAIWTDWLRGLSRQPGR